MRLEFGIYEFLRRFLPHHKRQINRLELFWWPFRELSTIWNSFTLWRSEIRYESNITGQKMSLENLLNRRVTGSNNAISIIEGSDGGVFLGLESENSDIWELSLVSENSDYKEIPLIGELSEALTVDFQVLVPAEASKDQVAAIINRYVIAGKNYEII